MKQIFKPLIIVLLILIPTTALAHDFEVDGIYYNIINSTEAAVTYKGTSFWQYSDEYQGSVNIPSTVNFGDISYSVSSIGDCAFCRCTGLIGINIPNSIISIGWGAFSRCTGLTNIDIPNSVTTIGTYAFGGCSGLISINIPNSVTTIGSDAFDGTAWYNNQPDGLIYAGLVAYKYKGTIPEETCISLRDGTVSIAENAFYGCSGLSNISIPNSVTHIDDCAFELCTGLTNLNIPNSVACIGNYAFLDCNGLTNITVENGNPKYDSRDNCNAIIETVTNSLIAGCMNTIIPNTVTSIGMWAFSNCTGLTTIDIPNSVTTVGYRAFYGCIGLATITIPYSVITIDGGAFGDCNGITRVFCLATTPPTINIFDFEEDAFWSPVINQATLYVPMESVSAYQTAHNWKDFSQIVGIPETPAIDDFEVDGVWYRAVDENTAMVISRPGEEDYYSGDVVIPEAVTYQDVTFTVTAIDEGAFEDCYDLNSVVIGDAVESIGENAFQGCTGLTSVTIGSGVTSIGAKAFNYCNALQTVTCRSSVPPVMANSNCFTNAAYSRAVLKVPRPEIEIYAAAVYWYKFSHIEGWGYLGPGDVNGSGTIDMDDLTLMINIMLTDDLGGIDPSWADVTGNGIVSMNDLTELINLLLTQ